MSVENSLDTLQLLEETRGNLVRLTVGSCSCLTKSNILDYHDDECRYKRLMLAYEEVEEMINEFKVKTVIV